MHLVLEWTFPARLGPQNVSVEGSSIGRPRRMINGKLQQ